MKSTLRYTTDKNGRQVAYCYSISAMRWIRISLDEAEMMRAMGEVKEICWGEKPLSANVTCVKSWDDGDVHNSVWARQ